MDNEVGWENTRNVCWLWRADTRGERQIKAFKGEITHISFVQVQAQGADSCFSAEWLQPRLSACLFKSICHFHTLGLHCIAPLYVSFPLD